MKCLFELIDDHELLDIITRMLFSILVAFIHIIGVWVNFRYPYKGGGIQLKFIGTNKLKQMLEFQGSVWLVAMSLTSPRSLIVIFVNLLEGIWIDYE